MKTRISIKRKCLKTTFFAGGGLSNELSQLDTTDEKLEKMLEGLGKVDSGATQSPNYGDAVSRRIYLKLRKYNQHFPYTAIFMNYSLHEHLLSEVKCR